MPMIDGAEVIDIGLRMEEWAKDTCQSMTGYHEAHQAPGSYDLDIWRLTLHTYAPNQ